MTVTEGRGAATAVVELDHPVDVGLTLAPLAHGGQLSTVLRPGSAWRATLTPEGPGTVQFRSLSAREVAVSAWGPGAGWLVAHAAAWVGGDDGVATFDPGDHWLVAPLAKRLAGLRMPRTGLVVEYLYPTILAQKVTSVEAARSHRALVRALGTPAPGPVDLLVPPAPARVAATPYWAFHRWGVERRRADTVVRVAAEAPLIDADLAADPSGEKVRRRLLAIPGVGPWTVGEVAQVALGDPDAVVVGDFHLPHQIGFAFTGRRRSDDDTMLAQLAPFAGHRGRVQRLVVAGTRGPARRAPRQRLRSFAGY